MNLTLSSGAEIEDPSDELIRFALGTLDIARDGEGFAILSRSPSTYVQVSGDARSGFDLEYQDQSIKQHFRARREDYSLDEVVGLLTAYRDGAVNWAEVGDFYRNIS